MAGRISNEERKARVAKVQEFAATGMSVNDALQKAKVRSKQYYRWKKELEAAYTPTAQIQPKTRRKYTKRQPQLLTLPMTAAVNTRMAIVIGEPGDVQKALATIAEIVRNSPAV